MRKKIMIVGCLLAAAGAAFWFFQPAAGYDIQHVDTRLLVLQQPYRRIATAYYLDGGSIGIEIVDRDGRVEQFAIPSQLGDTARYTKVFVGAMHSQEPSAVELAEPEHTKRMLICILQDYPNRTAYEDLALMSLSRRPVDFARYLVHRWRDNAR